MSSEAQHGDGDEGVGGSEAERDAGDESDLVTALAEFPQFCSLKFPTPGRFRA